MAKKLRSLALIALSAAMAVSVVGCGGGDTSSTASTGSTASSGGQTAVYTVRKGDTLWGIAGRYGVALTALIIANPQIKNPNLIYPGDQVRIP